MAKAFKFLFIIIFSFSCLTANAVTVENPADDIYISPGGNAETSFRVINRSNKEHQITVYQTDYFFNADGKNEYGSPGQHKRSNADWLEFTPKRFLIQPKSKVAINVTANIPQKSLSGTYWSVLMVEYIDAKATEAANTSNADIQSKVTVKRRTAIQIRTHISGTGEMKARYFNQSIKEIDGERKFFVDMENTGTLYFTGQFYINFFDSKGKPVEKILLGKKSLYPGCSARFSADISHLKKGNYTALCVYDTSGEKVFGGKYQIEIK
ncbi:MAG: hypothetical protein ACQETH_03360 [Candidatus Rifleibacteriota bacterium]